MAETIHIQQASMQRTDSVKEFRDDMDVIMTRGSDVIGFTETTNFAKALREKGKEHGYWVVNPDKGDCAIAVVDDHELLGAGGEFAVARQAGRAAAGGHEARYISWARFEFKGTIVTMHETHWSTGYGRSPRRREEHMSQTRELIDQVKKSAVGKRVGFFAGDINWDIDDPSDNRPAQVMEDGNLTTIFEELDKWPGTHHRRTIDIIGSYDPDRRVVGKRLKVWPDRTKTDHQQVSAWYSIL